MPSTAHPWLALAALLAAGCYTGHDWDVDGSTAETDCDDSDPTVHPGADELCGDGLDNDCDGVVDECCGIADLGEAELTLKGPAAGAKAGGALAGGEDLDGDGQPDLLVGAPEALARRGAVYFVPHSGLTQGSLTLGGATLRGDAPGSLAGSAVALAGDFDGDGIGDVAVGAPGAWAGSGGAAYLLRGPLEGDLSLAEADGMWEGPEDGAHLGRALAGGRDIDGDGRAELLIIASGDAESASPGGAYLVYGGELEGSGSPELGVDLVEDLELRPRAAAMLGDVNGDGTEEILVGLPGREDAECGVARLVEGPDLETRHDLQTRTCLERQEGGGVGSHVAAAGDVNADGYADFLVGAPLDRTQINMAGRVYLMLGSSEDQELDLDEAPARIEGEQAYHRAGVTAGPGDVNGDGFDDVLVGAEDLRLDEGPRSGAAYLIHGPVTGAVSISALYDLAEADLRMLGEDDGDQAGASLSGAGDIDGDGLADLLVGAPGRSPVDQEQAGVVYLLLGQACF